MNDNENAILDASYIEDDNFNFDELESKLEEGLEDSLSELEFLEKDKDKISNPENLGNAVMEVVWDQFVIQIGAVAGEEFIKENRGLRLDLRDEAHIQTTENFANGKIASHNTEIDYQQRYDDWQDNFQKDENGQIIKKFDKRSGKEKEVLKKNARAPFDKDRPKGSSQEHMDHTVSAGEIIRDPSANAHMTKEEQIAFANSKKNLNPLDSAANESKGDSTMSEWLDSDRNGEKPADRFNIDEDDLRKKDKEARKEYEKQKKEAEERSVAAGKRSQKAEAFRITGKALQAAVMGLLAELIRNIISKLVLWLKSKGKSFKTFLVQVKEAISTFLSNIKQNLITTGTTIASTVLGAIFGPVVSVIQKVWTIIKQGGKSVKEAIDYVKAPENRDEPFDILMLQVGKIIVTGLTAIGALTLGEAIEKGLETIPVFYQPIPLIGNLASVLGVFMGAVVSGIAGALVLNLIDKMIADVRKQEIVDKQIKAGNDALIKGRQLVEINKGKLNETKMNVSDSIMEHHTIARERIEESLSNISESMNNDTAESLLADIKKAFADN